MDPWDRDFRKKLLFRVFLHVNKELDDFQRARLLQVLGDGASLDTIRDAITSINQKIFLLSREGWKPERREGDAVLKPDHYDRYPMEPTYFIVESGGYHWCLANFIKYIARFRFKNGLEDLGKAMRNLSMYVQEQEGDEGWSR